MKSLFILILILILILNFSILNFVHAGPVASLGGLNGVDHSDMDSTWAPEWNSLVWYWKMNRNAGAASTTDFTIDKGTDTCRSFTGTSNFILGGKVDQALSMDAYQAIRCAGTDATALGTDMTIAFWVNNTDGGSPSSYRNLLTAKTGSTGVSIIRNDVGSQLYIRIDTSGGSNQTCYPTSGVLGGGWYHLAFTLTGTTVRIYRNGALHKTCSFVAGTGFASGGPIYFSGLGPGGTTVMDEVGIWSVALSAGDISTIYNKQLTALP